MKKSLLLSIALVICLLFAACGTDGTTAASTGTSTGSATSTGSIASTETAMSQRATPPASPFTDDDIAHVIAQFPTVQSYVELATQAKSFDVFEQPADGLLIITFYKEEEPPDQTLQADPFLQICTWEDVYDWGDRESSDRYEGGAIADFPAQLLPIEIKPWIISFADVAIPPVRGLAIGASKADVLATFTGGEISTDPETGLEQIVYLHTTPEDPDAWHMYDHLTYLLDADGTVVHIVHRFYTTAE
jgi:hypothetical protein